MRTTHGSSTLASTTRRRTGDDLAVVLDKRTVENDLKHQNLGLWSARHRAYNRELWREIVETGNSNAPAGARYMVITMQYCLVVLTCMMTHLYCTGMGKLTTISRPRSWIWEEGKGREKGREERKEKEERRARSVRREGRKGRPYGDFYSVGDPDKQATTS